MKFLSLYKNTLSLEIGTSQYISLHNAFFPVNQFYLVNLTHVRERGCQIPQKAQHLLSMLEIPKDLVEKKAKIKLGEEKKKHSIHVTPSYYTTD